MATQPGTLELLLGDIRDAFAKEGEAPAANMTEKLDVEFASADLVKALVAIEGRPWIEMGKSGKPLTQNRLARMLGANRAYVFARLSHDGRADLIEKVEPGHCRCAARLYILFVILSGAKRSRKTSNFRERWRGKAKSELPRQARDGGERAVVR